MSGSLNVDMMLKTERIYSRGSKRSNASYQKILILMRQRKDKVNGMETQFSASHLSVPSRTRPFLHSGFPSEQTLSASNNDSESFHCAVGPILAMAQLFGILPVSGICRPNPSQLKFAIFSFRTAYAVFINAIVLFTAIWSVINKIKILTYIPYILEVKDKIAVVTADTIFYGNSVIALIIFFWLSPRWTTLQCDWRSMEQFIDRNKMERPKLRWKFYVITASILLLALVHYILSTVVYITNYNWSGNSTNSLQNFQQSYNMSSQANYETPAYNFAIDDITPILVTFIWNFTDVFIMLVATGLAERYKMLNKHVVSATKHRTIDWCGLREDYAALSCMVKKVDNNITPLILLSFANNLYFICLHLFGGFIKADIGIISDIWFFGGFIFLIGRTVTVTLLAARIYDQSKMILPLLYTCPASTYNVETDRLIYLLTTDDTMLTGMRFFSITRKFLLAVTGAIVTFEVVLLQFNAAEKERNGNITSLIYKLLE